MVKRDEPAFGDGFEPTALNGRRASPPDHRLRIACVVSHLGIGADRQPRLCASSMDTARYQCSSGAAKARQGARQNTGKRLNQMGVWRDTHRSQ